MTASLLDGKQIANSIKQTIKLSVKNFAAQQGRQPSLSVILVGDDKASHIYVNNKHLACEEVGILSRTYKLPEQTTQQELLQLIDKLNNDRTVDGILIQLPLPQHINTDKVLETIKISKDVDGFHPYNLGRLAQRSPFLRPCTPMGIMRLLAAYNLPVKGLSAVVIGASNIVGRPMALELLHAGATVTVCHRFTQDLQHYVSPADLIVVATGIPDLVKPEWLNKNQIIIDVGMHRLENGKLRGDIDFTAASAKVAWITPVPGGVGPMTIVSLLENTLLAATQNLTVQ
jgi:methylenetetrahydrofolate dehydrogenase (NADP+)/methenyltetrahydrofolate cyclohydrolase